MTEQRGEQGAPVLPRDRFRFGTRLSKNEGKAVRSGRIRVGCEIIEIDSFQSRVVQGLQIGDAQDRGEDEDSSGYCLVLGTRSAVWFIVSARVGHR